MRFGPFVNAGRGSAFCGQAHVALMFTLIYLSETGVGETIGERINKEARSHQLQCQLHSAEHFAKVAWAEAPGAVFVFISSSTGDGDPPAKAIKFWRWLRSQPAGLLNGTRIAVLALGDSNYSSFMQMPRRLHTQLKELGAVDLMPRVEADDATPTGLETAVEPWVEKLFLELKRLLIAPPQSLTVPEDNRRIGPSVSYPRIPIIGFDVVASSAAPSATGHFDGGAWLASLQSCRCLTAPEALKQVLLVRFQALHATQARLELFPGDAVAVRCPNPVAAVDTVLQRLPAAHRGLVQCNDQGKGAWPHHVPPSIEARQVLSWYVDLGALPSKRLLRALAESCGEAKDRQALLDMCEVSAAGKERYAVLAAARWGLPELLEAYPSCTCPLPVLLSLLPPMKPRFYSLAGFSESHFDIAFTVVREGVFRGACSNWLGSLARCERLLPEEHDAAAPVSRTALLQQLRPAIGVEALAVPIFTREPTSFQLPRVVHAPVIMVGPGTGVAPFIAFLQHMETTRAVDPSAFPSNRLYSGCRVMAHDHLFGSELAAFQQRGVLHELHVAESRAGNKKYVQHLIADHAEAIADTLLRRNGYLYICGDARHMAPQVQEAVLRAFCQEGKMDEKVMWLAVPSVHVRFVAVVSMLVTAAA